MSVKNSSQLRPDMTNELVRIIVAGTRECFGFIQLVIYIDKIKYTCYPEVNGQVLYSYFNLILR